MGKQIVLIALVLVTLSSCDRFTSTRTKTAKGKSKEVIVNEKGDSIMVYYRSDGSIKSKATYKRKHKNGPAYNYYESGKIQNLIHYKDGYKHGLVTWNYESGKIYRETNYIEGQKDGIQKYYYKTGERKAEVPYKMGQLQLGTKEYTKSGKVIKDYPKIIVTPIDKMKAENTYYLQFSLDPPNSKAQYYLNVEAGNKGGKIDLERWTKKGIVKYPYALYPGQSIMQKEEIRTEIKSKRRIPIVLRRTYNLAVENRNY